MALPIDDLRFDGSRPFYIDKTSCSPAQVLSDKASKDLIKDHVKALSDYQEKLFASRRRSVLIVFQAMDAAGKDSTLERLIKGINPQGCQVHGFKKPTPEELEHDFLWRVNKKLPGKGNITVFNRSHYEEVLVTRVHPEYITYQNLPGIKSTADIKPAFWTNRLTNIRNYEKHLADSGTVIIKFFLNVSKEEQKRRLMDRMNEEDKHWKFNLGDIEERAHWEHYMSAYEEAIQASAVPHAPWYVIPADHKPTMRALVGAAVMNELDKYPVDFPQSGENIYDDIEEAKVLFDEEQPRLK